MTVAPWLVALLPSCATFVVGCIVGYGRAAHRLGTMEAQISALQKSVERLENLMLSHQ